VLALSAAGNGDGKAQKSEETPPEHPRDVILHDIAERLLVWQLSRRKGKPCINSLLNVFQLTLAQLHCSVAILLRGRWPHGSLPDNKNGFTVRTAKTNYHGHGIHHGWQKGLIICIHKAKSIKFTCLVKYITKAGELLLMQKFRHQQKTVIDKKKEHLFKDLNSSQY
jgi:hypothetical protein